MRESKNGDPVSVFIIQVAALSWAATQVPEITVAIQSFLNAGFCSAIQVELLFMIGCLHPVTKATRSPSFRIFVHSSQILSCNHTVASNWVRICDECRLGRVALKPFHHERTFVTCRKTMPIE